MVIPHDHGSPSTQHHKFTEAIRHEVLPIVAGMDFIREIFLILSSEDRQAVDVMQVTVAVLFYQSGIEQVTPVVR